VIPTTSSAHAWGNTSHVSRRNTNALGFNGGVCATGPETASPRLVALTGRSALYSVSSLVRIHPVFETFSGSPGVNLPGREKNETSETARSRLSARIKPGGLGAHGIRRNETTPRVGYLGYVNRSAGMSDYCNQFKPPSENLDQLNRTRLGCDRQLRVGSG